MPRPPRSDELTTPSDDELTTPYDTGEIRQLDRTELRRVLDLLAKEPLRMRSDNLVPRPWGGHRLVAFKELETQASPARYGESFEVAAYPLDVEAARYPSVVEFSDGSSMPLSELLGRAGETILGAEFFAAYGPNIPLLPKFLDVAGLLSVQSHPQGNPEAYIIIDADPGATVRLGFRREVDPAELGPRLAAARAQQEQLAQLVWVDEMRIAPIFAELLPSPDAPRRIVDRLVPLLRELDARAQLEGIVAELVACYREVLELLNEIPVEAGMVLFNADRRVSSTAVTAGDGQGEVPPVSAQIHCLGNPAGRAVLLLEIRRPGVTYRAWDHVRFPVRELAIETALASAPCTPSAPEDFRVELEPVDGRPGVLRSVDCPSFVIEHLRPRPGLAVQARTEGQPTTLHVIRGSARLRGAEDFDWGVMRTGESALLPAGLSALRVEGLAPDTELVQVTIPVPVRVHVEESEIAPGEVRRRNFHHLQRVVERSEGPREVLAIVNGGDGAEIGERLESLSSSLFRADGATRVHAHEESARRGQLLGLLDALRGRAQAHGPLDEAGVAVGIMLPGRGTRLSPLTQRLHGIKPLFPVPVRTPGGDGDAGGDAQGEWLDGATASLWSWVQVAWALERQGFRGVAWKWGDEPQVAARLLARLDDDLSDVDAVRFGASVEPSEALAEHKEWLVVDASSGDFVAQVRRRPLGQLRERMTSFAGDRKVEAFVHMGSPALSHLFLRHAERVFGELEGWLDVDGYLFEALTHDAAAWAAEIERDAGLRALLERCPDFYERVAELRSGVEAERGHPLRMVVVDLGADPYWGDVGQLSRAREAWALLAREGEEGEFARFLAGLDGVEPDAHGNLIFGEHSSVPNDGSVRDCVVIDAQIGGGRAEGAVLFHSKIGFAGLEAGAVVLDSHVEALRMEPDSLAFGSVGTYLRVPTSMVHTSIPADPKAEQPVLESWFADARVNVSAPEFYEQACWGNPDSFAAKFEQVRQREVSPSEVEARLAKLL